MVSTVREVENDIRKNIFNIALFKRKIYFQHSEAAVAAVIFSAPATRTLQQWMGFVRITASTPLLKIKIDFNHTGGIYFIILNSKHINKLIEGICYFRQTGNHG